MEDEEETDLGGARLSTVSFSEHGYDTVGLINSMRNTVMNTVDLGRVCKLTRYMVREPPSPFADCTTLTCPFFPFPSLKTLIVRKILLT